MSFNKIAIPNYLRYGIFFTPYKNNAVYHYDVQVGFVDNLVFMIEEIWKILPELDFVVAMKQSVRKFGAGSFTRIYREKERELKKKYNRMLWRYVIDF
ncbi:MAG: hypothetical protein R3182_10990 [Draconibacterium sp.]|nr:hypothetical protein [Draconibacterium sp.]